MFCARFASAMPTVDWNNVLCAFCMCMSTVDWNNVLCAFWKCMTTVDWNNNELFFGSLPTDHVIFNKLLPSAACAIASVRQERTRSCLSGACALHSARFVGGGEWLTRPDSFASRPKFSLTPWFGQKYIKTTLLTPPQVLPQIDFWFCAQYSGARAIETRRTIWQTLLQWIVPRWVLPQWDLVCHPLQTNFVYVAAKQLSSVFHALAGWNYGWELAHCDNSDGFRSNVNLWSIRIANQFTVHNIEIRFKNWDYDSWGPAWVPNCTYFYASSNN